MWLANLALTWLVYVQSELKRLLIFFLKLVLLVFGIVFFSLRVMCLSFLAEGWQKINKLLSRSISINIGTSDEQAQAGCS